MVKLKKNIAFIKYLGCTAGGTEKFLQTIAANLNKNQFNVDYYYSDKFTNADSNYMHQDTKQERLDYLKKNNVNLFKFQLENIDFNSKDNKWINTNFWDIFDEKNYDLIQIASSGLEEYPFNHIKTKPIVDSMHISVGVQDQENRVKVLIQSEDLTKKYIKAGGKKEKVVNNCTPIDEKKEFNLNLRDKFSLNNKFIFGMHQRVDDSIFSDVPLFAYSKIEDKNTSFIIMGGSKKYSDQAKKLQLKNFIQIDFENNLNIEEIFLNTLDVFAHGRKDGETFGLAIAEAMRNSLPIISHKNVYNNAQVETIGNGGVVVSSLNQYVRVMKKLKNNKKFYKKLSYNSRSRYLDQFEATKVIRKIEDLYFEVIRQYG